MVNKKDINNSIEESIFKKELSGIVEKGILEVVKCSGPSAGIVDGIKYHKDNKQRITDDKAPMGDIEQRQLDAQIEAFDKTKLYGSDLDYIRKCNDFPADVIGFQLHGDDYSTENIEEPGDEDYGGSYGWGGGYEADVNAYWSELDDAVDSYESAFRKVPGLVEDTMLFAHDIPNPDLEEGDVFQLDTCFGVNFKEKMRGSYDDMWSDVDIPYLRKTNEPIDPYYNYSDDKPYDVKVLASKGTPILMPESFYRSGHINVHEGVLKRGQSVRLVRVDHDKRTAIYQTVDG